MPRGHGGRWLAQDRLRLVGDFRRFCQLASKFLILLRDFFIMNASVR